MTNTSRKSLQEGTRSGKGEGSHNLTEGDSTEIPYKLAESFLKNNQNKNKLNEYLYHQALKVYTNILIMLLIKLGISEDGV